MVKVTYTGVSDPIGEFEALTPLVDRLRKLQLKCRPMGRDYCAITIALEAIDTTAYHFTRRPHFYSNLGNQR
ncbi:MAG: hypothetical protein ACJ798_15640 [Phenylobacterium sp.]